MLVGRGLHPFTIKRDKKRGCDHAGNRQGQGEDERAPVAGVGFSGVGKKTDAA